MRIHSSIEKYANSLFQVTENIARDKDGYEIKRAVVEHPGSATVCVLDDRNRLLLVEQYRLPTRRKLWEIPAGKIDEGETPLQAAKRELKEETGYRARSWKKLITFWPSPGFLAEKMTIYLAQDLIAGAAEPTEDERITARWFTTKEFEALIDAGKLTDAKTLIAYFLWRRSTRARG
ncbi:MAG: NUDIX hydrolase [Bryobacter sp.]|nr:NUDIX hydrolase [Bryobacter sp.]